MNFGVCLRSPVSQARAHPVLYQVTSWFCTRKVHSTGFPVVSELERTFHESRDPFLDRNQTFSNGHGQVQTFERADGDFRDTMSYRLSRPPFSTKKHPAGAAGGLNFKGDARKSQHHPQTPCGASEAKNRQVMGPFRAF